MDTHSYIINDIKPFNISSKIKDIQKVFNQLTYSHIPVSENDVFKGCISENDAYCFDGEKKLSEYLYALEDFHVKKDTNWLDILEAFAIYTSNIMPVLDEQNNYIGYYELRDIIALFNNTPFLYETGGIIVIEKGSADYSFSEISQCVETNDGKILGIFISKIENDITQATIKIGHSGINAIVQTLRRYGYNVISQHGEDKMLNDLKERSDYLDKYLNI